MKHLTLPGERLLTGHVTLCLVLRWIPLEESRYTIKTVRLDFVVGLTS